MSFLQSVSVSLCLCLTFMINGQISGWGPHSAFFCSVRKQVIFTPRHSTRQRRPRLNHARRLYCSVWPGSTFIVVSQVHDVSFPSVLPSPFIIQPPFWTAERFFCLPQHNGFSQSLIVRNESRRRRLISDLMRWHRWFGSRSYAAVSPADPSARQ